MYKHLLLAQYISQDWKNSTAFALIQCAHESNVYYGFDWKH